MPVLLRCIPTRAARCLDGCAIEMTEISDRIVESGQGVVLKSTSGSITMTRTNETPAGDFSGNSL